MFSLILPTFNESGNIVSLLNELSRCLTTIEYEIIVVDDDSPDGTWRLVQEYGQHDAHVRVVRRVGERGLSSAVLRGFETAKGNVLAVMDADGQHDTQLLLTMNTLVNEGKGVVIGSRYIAGGSIGEWDERRHTLSRIATALAVRLCRVRVKDPMSGFFALSRSVYEQSLPSLNPKGFKILLDFLVHLPAGTTVEEIPLQFGVRTAGESKLSRRVQLEFVQYLYDVTLGKYITPFASFCVFLICVGAVCLYRLLPLLPLYIDRPLQTSVRTALLEISGHQGWLVSDISLTRVTSSGITLTYTPHRRLPDAGTCFQFTFADSSLTPCAD
ncbi:MAG: polyprenol monophosphomannose synthase [Candidatus Peribacteraceae bacterium]|nr:polyprenol monophosphomannose synthase [Candidatus Peribacteraceae bacterium]